MHTVYTISGGYRPGTRAAFNNLDAALLAARELADADGAAHPGRATAHLVVTAWDGTESGTEWHVYAGRDEATSYPERGTVRIGAVAERSRELDRKLTKHGFEPSSSSDALCDVCGAVRTSYLHEVAR